MIILLLSGDRSFVPRTVLVDSPFLLGLIMIWAGGKTSSQVRNYAWMADGTDWTIRSKTCDCFGARSFI